MVERLQKVLARAGYGSRRQLEEWIRAGRITLNGAVAELGARVAATDQVCIDGRQVNFALALESRRSRILLYHKPAGEVTTRSDPEGRPTVFDTLPHLKTSRWIVIGRLDINTSGVLLFTTDGELAHRLIHPSGAIEREYAVRVLGNVSRETIQRLTLGVELEDGPAKFASVRDGGGSGANHWYHVVLHEGRNREVRRLWESQGVMPSRLIRTRFGPIQLPRNLRAGNWQELSPAQCKDLMLAAGFDAKQIPADSARPKIHKKRRRN